METIHNLKYLHSNRYFWRQFLSFRLKPCRLSVQNYSEVKSKGVSYARSLPKRDSLEVNTNVAKDVMLFRYDNPTFFRILHAFALFQFGFWTYLAAFAYTSLKDVPVTEGENLPWWRKFNLGDPKFRTGLSTISLFIGCGILGSSLFVTLRSVRFLVLRKGGQEITFVTYGPFGMNRTTTVSLNKVSCDQSRHSVRVQLPLKVQGSFLHYVLDMRGEFTNPKLFDYTAGMKRNIKK